MIMNFTKAGAGMQGAMSGPKAMLPGKESCGSPHLEDSCHCKMFRLVGYGNSGRGVPGDNFYKMSRPGRGSSTLR